LNLFIFECFAFFLILLLLYQKQNPNGAKMTALEKLKDKIDLWKSRIAELEELNDQLQLQLDERSGNNTDCTELENKLAEHEQTIKSLKQELLDKDDEIEEIIAKVEALLA